MIKLGLYPCSVTNRSDTKVQPILRDPEPALYGEFQHLPHGRGFRSLAHKTNRRGNSFFPTAVPLLKAWSAIWIVVTILYGFTRVAVWLGLSGDPAKCEYDSSGVLCMWVGWSMGVCGGGLEGYKFSAVIICIMDFLFWLKKKIPVCLRIYYHFKCFSCCSDVLLHVFFNFFNEP